MKITIGSSNFRASDVARACGGQLVGADRAVLRVCTDSREAAADDLFVALRGERTDGHVYILKAIEQGCRVVLCEAFPELPEGAEATAVVVPDTSRALCALAESYLNGKNLVRVAVTGSVGKTTTKEFLRAILSQRFNTYKTEANYNSTIGMSVSALGVSAAHTAAVLEMGMSARGEIEALSRIARPDVALITNIGSSHLEYLKTRENIALAKLEITAGLHEGGLLVLNGDEPLLADVASEHYRVCRLCVAGEGDYTVTSFAQCHENWTTTFCLRTPTGEVLSDLRIPAIGQHMVYDAAYAVAVGLELGLSEQEIRAGLAEYQGLRQHLVQLGDITVLEDCYNAAPESMSEALHVLVSYARARGTRAVAVLGDMRELGENSRQMHETIGAEVAALGVDVLFTLGELGVSIAEGALGAGMTDGCVHMFRETDDLTDAATAISERLHSGDIVLLKASRALAAERMIDTWKEFRQTN